MWTNFGQKLFCGFPQCTKSDPDEALHFFSVENVRWRALPERFGFWNSVWKRSDRLSKAGVFEAFFDTLGSMSDTAHLVQMFDSTIVRAHVSAAGAKGAARTGAWSLPRWLYQKNYAKFDASGDIIAFDLTGGEASDGRHFETLLDIGPDLQPRAVICDKGYASKANQDTARKRGIAPMIPHKANEKNKPVFFARTLYKARARIEQGIGRLKRFKRVASGARRLQETFDLSSPSLQACDQIRPHDPMIWLHVALLL